MASHDPDGIDLDSSNGDSDGLYGSYENCEPCAIRQCDPRIYNCTQCKEYDNDKKDDSAYLEYDSA